MIWWARWESNPQSLRNTILSRARIPVPPLALVIFTKFCSAEFRENDKNRKTTEVLYNKAKLMHSSSDGSDDQFDASLKLPHDQSDNGDDRAAAAELIRKKVEAAYAAEPDV